MIMIINNKYRPASNILVKSYLGTRQQMLQCSQWVNPLQGERVKVPVGLKLYYEYRLQRFNHFVKIGSVYNESTKSCADSLGVSLSSIENNYNPLLKKMGLLEITKVSSKVFTYQVYSLADIKGWLINPTFALSKKEKRVYDDSKIDYEQLKNLEHNKRVADRVKRDTNTRHYMMSEDQRKEYIQLKREFNINE